METFFFGDLTGLGSLVGELSDAAGRADLARSQANTAVTGLLSDTTGEEARVAALFADKWDSVSSLICSVSSAGRSTEEAVTQMASMLQSAADSFDSGLLQASIASAQVEVLGRYVQVTPATTPLPTGDASSVAAIAVARQQASVIQGALQDAVDEAVSAWSSAYSELAGIILPPLDDLPDGSVAVYVPPTGDSGVDEELDRLVTAILRSSYFSPKVP